MLPSMPGRAFLELMPESYGLPPGLCTDIRTIDLLLGEVLREQEGQWIIDAHFPPQGTPTQPVEAGYMANAWLRMKHPDYDELRRMP